jgi:hypothetical protein
MNARECGGVSPVHHLISLPLLHHSAFVNWAEVREKLAIILFIL